MKFSTIAFSTLLLAVSSFSSAETITVTTTGDITPETTLVKSVSAQGKCTYVGELIHKDQKSYVVLYEVKTCASGYREIVSKTIAATTTIGEIPLDRSCDPMQKCPRKIPAGTPMDVTWN